jgi:capsular polysaccharide biosynthesis protein
VAASLAAARAWFVVVTLTAVGAAAAAGYGLTAPKRYSATAQLLVAPVSASDATFAGLDVLRDASGKRTAAESAAVLVRSPQVADAVRAQLAVRRSSASLLHSVRAHVVGTSDVVDVTVEDTSAASSAQLANAFVDALLSQRTSSFQSQLSSAIRRDAQLLADGSAGPQSVELARRLALLRSFQGQPDPTLRRASAATVPPSASWPDVPAFVAIGAGVGLAVGVVLGLGLLLLRRPKYDRRMPEGRSERVAEALVDRLEQRLQAREAALAARERDLQAKIDELQSLAASGVDAALAERERQLEERVALVTKREVEVARRAASIRQAPPRDDERERQLAERERRLEERVAAVTRREVAPEDPRLAERARELEQRDQELARREQQVREREQERTRPAPFEPAAPPQARVPAPAAPAPAAAEADGAFNLGELQRLVEAEGPRFPERLEEWRSYLFFLRDYAEPDGTLPPSFDWLVQDTFRELLH